jgi:PPOX class probable F420-dependent enzyme
MIPVTPFEAFEGQRYLSLETFKKNGEGVRTPVWFAEALADSTVIGGMPLYVYTIGNSGKVKRIRNNPQVRIAPCDMRGNVQGDWVNATATIVHGEEEAFGMALIDRKYRPWKQILNLMATLRGHERVVLVLKPR